MPSRILLFRHAEKPDDDKSVELSLRGRIRAAALALHLPHRFGVPTHLIATKATRESDRPTLTLQPLSEALGLPIDTRFDNMAYEELARVLVEDPGYRAGNVFICWHHGTIPELAEALGVQGVPNDWDDDVFDRIWVFEGFPRAVALTRVHQKLLFGDRE
jgi:hypothetical protein